MLENNKIIAITGATGFVGKNLQKKLHIAGFKTIQLNRYDLQGSVEALAPKLNKADAIINLAGAPIIGRWTDDFKKILYESRVIVTQKLVGAIALMDSKPETLVSTSAIGIYASEGNHSDDSFSMADNYLGKLASGWEQAALEAEKLGVRTTIFRLGVVIGKNGGALKKMLFPFKLGLGGVIGSGEQHFSWIHLDDVVAAYVNAVTEKSYKGIYNLTAPEVTTNRGFTKELGRTLSRPTIFPVPEFILSLMFGEGALILTSGQSAYPKRLIDSGFTFQFSHLSDALKDCTQ